MEEFLSNADPSILHFLIASGDDITSKQLRDDLMTLLIAGHETTAAVLTWTFHLIVDRPDVIARMREEVRAAARDACPQPGQGKPGQGKPILLQLAVVCLEQSLGSS